MSREHGEDTHVPCPQETARRVAAGRRDPSQWRRVMNPSPAPPCTHEEAFDLIPWSITGRIEADDQLRLQRHLVECAACRVELAEQQRVRSAVRREYSNIEYAPQASLQKLMARIDATEASAVRNPAPESPES